MITTEERAQRVTAALAAAMGDDEEEVIDAVMYLIEDITNGEMYSVCRYIADHSRAAMESLNGSKIEDDEMAALVDTRPPGAPASAPSQLFAMRFFVAHLNNDNETAEALFLAAFTASTQEQCASIMALIIHTGELLKHAYDAHMTGHITMTPLRPETGR